MSAPLPLAELLTMPFLQRALLAGMLSGALGGLLGSFAVLRQLSFSWESPWGRCWALTPPWC